MNCSNCSYSFHKDDLKHHAPTDSMLCDDCLQEFLAMDEEQNKVDTDKNGHPIEQYWLGWRIFPVFHYSDGKSDFEIYSPDGESGSIRIRTTVLALRNEIEEMEPETSFHEPEPDMDGPNQAERDEQHFAYQRFK